jgi:hypothetical protein
MMSVTLLAAPAGRQDHAADAARATLRQVAAMTPEQQQAWLRELESRLDWANRVALGPEDAAREQARVAAMLHRKTVSLQTLLELVRELDGREKDAIARLVAAYRGQVYRTFDGRGSEFTRRQEAWYRVWDAWEAAGSPIDQQDRLMAWLEGAVRNSLPGKIGPLPPDPQFSRQRPPPAMLAARTPGKATGKTVQTGPKPATASGQIMKRHAPDVDGPLLAQRKLPPASTALPEPALARVEPDRQAARVRSSASAGQSDLPETRGVPPPIVPGRRALPRRPTGEEFAAAPPSLPARGVATPPSSAQPAPPSITPAAPPAANAVVHGAKTRTNLPSAPRGGDADITGDAAGSTRTGVAARGQLSPRSLPESSPTLSGGGPQREPPQVQHDLLAMLPRPTMIAPMPAESKAVASRPRAENPVNRTPEGDSSTAMEPKPAQPPADAAAEGSPVEVKVNLEELTAQIAGNNLTLRTLSSELDDKGPWDAGRLEKIIRRLDVLVVKQQDLALFVELVTPAQRALAGRIDSPKQVISQLAARIVEARTHAQAEDFRGSQSQRQAELDRLDALSARLGKMAVEK